MRRAASLGLLLGACATPQDDAAQGKESGEAPRRCNGHAALCDRPFDQLTLPGTHNSMSAADEGWLGPNQQHGIERQLEDGVRALMLDTYEEEGELLLCHGYCSLGSRPLVEALVAIDGFLAAHPDDLIVIIFQDGIPVASTEAALRESGLLDRAYAERPARGAWPTLGALTAGGAQLIVGLEAGRPPPAALQHAWDLYQDTPYSFGSGEEFSCAANRGGPDSPLLLVNHWLGPLPSEERAAEVNVAAVLQARAEACAAARGMPISFLGVDHYAVGDLFAVVDALNGVGDTGG
jgi:hypothetical protein